MVGMESEVKLTDPQTQRVAIAADHLAQSVGHVCLALDVDDPIVIRVHGRLSVNPLNRDIDRPTDKLEEL